MFLRITNKTVSFISYPFVSYVDMCCFQDIKQLLFTLSTDMAVKNTNLQRDHSLTDKTDMLPDPSAV